MGTVMARDIDPLGWYVVMTNARYEPLVNKRLRADGFRTFWPHFTEQVRTHRGRGLITKLRSYFPRYLFVSPDPGQSLYRVNNTVGVATVLHGDDGPYVVPDQVVRQVRKKCNADGLLHDEHRPTPGARQLFKAGEEVTIKDGPLAGFLALVNVDLGDQIKVEVEMFRGRVTAELRPDQVRTGGRKRRSVA